MTLEQRAREEAEKIAGIFNCDPRRAWAKDYIDEISSVLLKFAEEELEKTYSQGFLDVRREATASERERCARVVQKYKDEGKYETGHGFMTDLDEIAVRIRSGK